MVGKNLRNLVNKIGNRPNDKPIVWLSEKGREILKAQRSDPKFQKKSTQCLKNRTEEPNATTLHRHGIDLNITASKKNGIISKYLSFHYMLYSIMLIC